MSLSHSNVPIVEEISFICSPTQKHKNKLKAQREKDLREWLHHHSTAKICEDAEEVYRHEQIHAHLVDGVSMSAMPEKQLYDNLLFAAPLKSIRNTARGNKFIPELHRTAKFPEAIKTLQKYDKDGRWAAGVNANTLMTEYRRKVILHAYGYENGDGVDEPREVSQEKLKLYMQANCSEHLDEADRVDAKRVSEEKAEKRRKEREAAAERGRRKREKEQREQIKDYSITGKYENFIQGSRDRTTKGFGCTVTSITPYSDAKGDPKCNFQPKFEDYDVMHNRWRYLLPEINALLTRETMAPESITRQVYSRVSKSTVTGSFRDVIGHEERHTNVLSRTESVKGPHATKAPLSLSQRFSIGSSKSESVSDTNKT